MFRPLVESAAPRILRSPLHLASAALVVALALAALFGSVLRPADAVTISSGGGAVPIVALELQADGDLLTQTEPRASFVDHGHEAVEVAAVVVDDGGHRRLVPRPGTVDVTNIGFPADLLGVSVSQNGAQTPVNTAGFESAIERTLASTDLRDYVRADRLSRSAGDWDHDYDILFDSPLRPGDHLLVQERNGNSSLQLTALGDGGEELGRVLVGDRYDWNTGFAPADASPAQPVHLTVVDIEVFLGDATEVHGFRIDNDDEADLKVTPLVPATTGQAAQTPALLSTTDPAAPTTIAATGPAVALVKHVYVGHDGGAGCPGAQTFAETGPTEPVTYCITVTNSGSTHLADIVVSDPLVAGEPVLVSAESTPLAPGHSARYLLETTPPADDADGFVDDTYINLATVTATPVAPDGAPIEGAAPVSDDAEAVVFPAEGDDAPEPDVALAASVYAGIDSGAGCPALNTSEVSPGHPVTYCFTVTNLGNTHLDGIAVAEPLAPIAPVLLRADSQPLAPGDSAHFFAESVAPEAPTGQTTTSSMATANPVDASGADLVGLGDVSSTDSATVTSPPEPAASPPANLVAAPPAAGPADTSPEGATPPPEAPAAPTDPGTTPDAMPSQEDTGPGATSAPGSDAAGSPDAAPSPGLPAASSDAAGSPDAVPGPATPMGGLVADPAGSSGTVGTAGTDPDATAVGAVPAAGADATKAATAAASGAAGVEGPTELAFTGWESWLIAFTGIGLIALGWLLMHPERADRARRPVRG